MTSKYWWKDGTFPAAGDSNILQRTLKGTNYFGFQIPIILWDISYLHSWHGDYRLKINFARVAIKVEEEILKNVIKWAHEWLIIINKGSDYLLIDDFWLSLLSSPFSIFKWTNTSVWATNSINQWHTWTVRVGSMLDFEADKMEMKYFHIVPIHLFFCWRFVL